MNFVLFRHGHSIANQESRIVSSLDHGTQGFGLSARGKEEVAESAKTLAYHIIASTLTPQKHPTRVQIVTSPFKRTLETASIIHEHLLSAFSTSRVLADENKKIVLGAKVDVVQDLRERFFGEFDMKTPSDHLYNIVWEADGANPFHEQYGVESVSAVTERVTGVIRSLEKQYHKTAKLEDREQKATDLTKAELESTEQEDVELENEKLEADQEDPEQRKEEVWTILVSHGDSLQILQTAMKGWSGDRHRQLEHLGTAQWRVVDWCPELQDAHRLRKLILQ